MKPNLELFDKFETTISYAFRTYFRYFKVFLLLILNHWFIFHGNCMENSVLSVPSLKNFFEIFFGLIIIFVDHFLSPPQMSTLRRVSPQSSAPDLFRPKLKQNLPNVLNYYPSRVWHIPKPCLYAKELNTMYLFFFQISFKI